MPPKAKFSKEEITKAALSIVREKGMQGLTARALGDALGSSSRPIFTTFHNMEEVSQAVIKAADDIYQNFLNAEMGNSVYPPYKASGMGYIRFAKEECELFKLLFMRDRSHEEIKEEREQLRPLLDILRKNMGLSEEDAFRFHMEMWIYVHGIATMFATSYLNWDEDFISDVMTDAFEGMKIRWQQKM